MRCEHLIPEPLWVDLQNDKHYDNDSIYVTSPVTPIVRPAWFRTENISSRETWRSVNLSEKWLDVSHRDIEYVAVDCETLDIASYRLPVC